MWLKGWPTNPKIKCLDYKANCIDYAHIQPVWFQQRTRQPDSEGTLAPATLLPARWMGSSSASSFVYSLEGRKIFLEVQFTKTQGFHFLDASSSHLFLMQKLGGTSSPSFCSPAAVFQEKLWCGCIKWGRGLRLWKLVSQTCLWQQNSNMHVSLGKRLSEMFSFLFFFLLLLVCLQVPALSILAPVKRQKPAYRDSGI